MQKTLLLVDGSSYLYRAFHAMPDMRSPDGAPTGALYGIINMLRRLRHDYPTEYIACVFDAKGKTFRDALYPEYKATRASMPEDLVQQIAPIHETIRALGWPILMVEGVEADDVIGTLSVIATQEGLDTIVSTGDKDMAQLVNPHVTLVNTMSNETMTREAVIEKFGVPPERIVDYLSLVGDKVDNVPGVEKVGPKTAVKWIEEFGSLEGVMQHAADVGGKVGENLRAALDWLPMGKELVTIKLDCDLSAHMSSITETLVAQGQDNAALKELFTRYNFRTWLKEVDANAFDATNSHRATLPAITIKADSNVAHEQGGLFDAMSDQPADYETILTEAQLQSWIDKINVAELTAVDTETTSLIAMEAELVGISLCCEKGKACYIPVAHHYQGAPEQLSRDKVLALLKPWLEDETKPKVGQNAKYDTHIFENYGVHLRGVVHDTLLESYILESHRTHDMDSLALRHLGHKTIAYTDVCGKGAAQIGFDQVALEPATAYAAEDADVTLALHQALWPQLASEEKLRYVYEKIEIPTEGVLQKIERNGVLIDSQLLGKQSHQLGLRLIEIEQQAFKLAEQEFNLNSPKQLGEILFDKLKLPVVKKTKSGAASTDEEVLQKLAEDYPLPKILLEYRSLAKLKSTYTDKLPKMVNPKTGRVHTNYAQAVAVTGRLASSDPNLQNIPVRTEEGRHIREAFIASPGCTIISADYSQIELRIMAHISEDPNMLKAFAQGVDIHRATASEIFGVPEAEVTSEQRRYSKAINFGLIYGMSAFGLAANIGIERSAAQMYIEKYFQRFAEVKRFMDETRVSAKDRGYVETIFGRRLWLPDIQGGNGPRRQAAERAAINAPMQGTAADLIKLAMVAVQTWLEEKQLKSKLIMQVHDELIMEVPEDEQELVKTMLPTLMQNVAKLKVPLIAEVGMGPNWETAH